MAQKTSALICPGSAFREEQPLSSPQSSLHRQWQRRRNSLVVVTKHQNTFTKKVMVCVLQVPMTTATKAAKLQSERNVAQRERSEVELVRPSTCVLQRPSSSAASSFNNTTLHQRLDDEQVHKTHPKISENITQNTTLYQRLDDKQRQHTHPKLLENTTQKQKNTQHCQTIPHERQTTGKTGTDGVCTENIRKSWEERRIVSHTLQRRPSYIDAGLLP